MNKSEKLCKLLGIEPKYNIYRKMKTRTDKYIRTITKKGIKLVKLLDTEYIIEIFPDLTKPSNFVKLLNIVYNCKINNNIRDFALASMNETFDDGIGFPFYEEEYITYEKVWLTCLKLRLTVNNPDSWDKKFKELIEQQSQQIKWQY